jgi:hypothetical protein
VRKCRDLAQPLEYIGNTDVASADPSSLLCSFPKASRYPPITSMQAPAGPCRLESRPPLDKGKLSVTTRSTERDALTRAPAYLEERGRQAREASLVLEKQLLRPGMMSSWYSGTEAQLRSARMLRIAPGFEFPGTIGARKRLPLALFSPAAPYCALKCSLTRIGADRFRLAIVNEPLPDGWRVLNGRIDVYKYCEADACGPATVYVGPFAALRAAGIAPPEAEREVASRTSAGEAPLWRSEALGAGRYRFVVYHEAEVNARAQEEERGRSSFANPGQYREWLHQVVASSAVVLRRQLRVRTRNRYVYTVPARTLKEIEMHLARIRKAIARSEILVEKEDLRAEAQREALRRAALAAMRDPHFQRFLGKAITPPSKRRLPD